MKSFADIAFIILGVVIGTGVGYLLAILFEKVHIRDTSKGMILLCAAFILVTVEDEFSGVIPFASLIAVMASGNCTSEKARGSCGTIVGSINCGLSSRLCFLY